MQTIKIIFPHQLFKDTPLFFTEGPHYLIEEYLFFQQYNFHQQKIAFHRASMKYYENYLIEQGHAVTYINTWERESDIRELIPHLRNLGVEQIIIIDPADNWLIKRTKEACKKCNINLKVIDSPLFLNTTEELNVFFNKSKKKFFQTEFYKQERIKRKILIDKCGGPEGDQWSYDIDNRKKYPKGKQIIKVDLPLINKYIEEAHIYTKKYFPNNIGELDNSIIYPIGFKECEEWLQQFLAKRLNEFGDYEDAIVHKEVLLNHSLLTPILNVGLISPQQIIDQTIAYGLKHQIPLNSLEGFIRQIIGWREFIRGVYITKGSEERTKNYWGFSRKIPKSFYDGTTGILPIDETIKKVLKTGYCHHIERLMVLGNFMLLCEFDPDEVYRWFMELFIDAYDWVMVPNIYGMSQFADGGMMSTKPYFSGSNYLMKMSDYPKGPWQEIWDALFWRFLDQQREFFLKNPRLGMLVKTYDKWNEDKKAGIHETANNYLNSLTDFPIHS